MTPASNGNPPSTDPPTARGWPDQLVVIPLGVGDAFSRFYYSTTFLIVADGRLTLIDAPDPARKVLAESTAAAGLPCDLTDIDDLILTHVHGDHVNGLECYGFFKYFVQRRRARLWTAPDVAANLWDERLKAAMGRIYSADLCQSHTAALDDYYDLRFLDYAAPITVNGLTVEIYATRHTVPCFGLRITHRGRRFGYSADTCFLPELIDFLAPCDLIFHETNYGPHTPYAKLAELPEDLRSRMRLVHYPDDFDQAASVIACARQGQAYVV